MIVKMLLGSMHESARTAPITKLDQIALFQVETVVAEVSAAFENFEFYKGINAINRWINIDVSGFYLEAMKDRLYTGDGGGVLEEIFHGLLRMLTPITPNLVAEAWDHLPEWMKLEDQVNPFHRSSSEPLTSRNLKAPADIGDDIPWLLNANTAIKTAQEEARAKKLLGSSLESSVVISLPPEADRSVFDRYADELESIFVVSSVEFDSNVVNRDSWSSAIFDAPGGSVGKVWILPPKQAKCPRCWRYMAPAENELCRRCEDVVS
jgi:isoleucyl-tRNA synthetase